MGVIQQNFSKMKGISARKTGGSVAAVPSEPRRRAVFKPIMSDNVAKKFSNSNRPLIIYDSKPLEQTLEQLSFSRKPKRKEGMGVKLTL